MKINDGVDVANITSLETGFVLENAYRNTNNNKIRISLPKLMALTSNTRTNGGVELLDNNIFVNEISPAKTGVIKTCNFIEIEFPEDGVDVYLKGDRVLCYLPNLNIKHIQILKVI